MYIILRELIEDTEAREQNLSRLLKRNIQIALEIKNLRFKMLTEGLEETVE